MHSIRRADNSDSQIIAQLGRKTFVESHGHSASEKSISNFLERNYTKEALAIELINPKFIYFIIEFDKTPVGFSKIILNTEHILVEEKSISLLDRIYLLEEYHDKKLGWILFQHLVEFTTAKNQKGMWLHTWIENKKAIIFYKKAGFQIIGSYDYNIDETHSNPNHVMHMKY
ncbi:MAG: GNAT family N-acetyltransferase [Flavobacteriales bacterium]|jgi:diamine N-acetyltransferase|nr:GNAT family N-acetyltransferase [Crocinitomicaceae bacterium]